ARPAPCTWRRSWPNGWTSSRRSDADGADRAGGAWTRARRGSAEWAAGARRSEAAPSTGWPPGRATGRVSLARVQHAVFRDDAHERRQLDAADRPAVAGL